MPLAFDSLSHGKIAFGFFNIESDMLMCERYFLFADKFCNYVEDIVDIVAEPAYKTGWQIRIIETRDEIGDLMGAIHGMRHTGFIGELYRNFPFPDRPEAFKQNPNGFATQSRVAEIIAKYAELRQIPVMLTPDHGAIQIGDYRFSRIQFQDLITYVWRGGYPRWKDDIKPGYVKAMRDKILRNCNGIFEGISL